ncbi:MAG: hypothetical protein LQ346_002387 [Caloplaca aetnensis]|nr:MAG: hypothetical protein LQ346_002387 [Caloplaca aetnensis]
MDEATAELIYRLQLDDLEEAKQMSKGKGREHDSVPDAELALQLQQEELEREARVRADHRMATSIGRAVQDDGANIAIMAGEESRAAGDRAMACRLGGQTARPHPQMRVLDVDDDILSRLDAFSIDDTANYDSSAPSPTGSEAGESSAWAAGRRLRPSSDLKRQCVSCLVMKHVIQVPCGDYYCRPCTVRLFTQVLQDESLFPVRCCRQAIQLSLVHHYLGSDLARRVEKKAIEYGTTNRTYCHIASCATFIDPGHIRGSTGTCPIEHCKSQTCVLCKRAAHDGNCPPRDDGLEQALQLAQANGWQQCEQCHNVVELGYGCNHMT